MISPTGCVTIRAIYVVISPTNHEGIFELLGQRRKSSGSWLSTIAILCYYCSRIMGLTARQHIQIRCYDFAYLPGSYGGQT